MSDEYDVQKEVVEDELQKFKQEYDKVYSNLAQNYANAGDEMFATMRKLLTKANRDLTLLEKEIPGTRDIATREQREMEHSELKATYDQYKSDLSNLEISARKAAISSGAVEDEPLTSEQRLCAAVVVQEDTNVRVKDTINIMQEVVMVNDAILESLDRDMERLNRVSDELDGLQADTMLARRQLRNILRSMAANKCMLCVMLVISFVILIVSIVDLSSSLKS